MTGATSGTAKLSRNLIHSRVNPVPKLEEEEEEELPTLPEHLSSPPVFSGVRVTRSLVLCVCPR
jgi:hypothetical protein